MNNEELKNCAFCNNKPSVEFTKNSVVISCKICGFGYPHLKENYVFEWNKRMLNYQGSLKCQK